MQLPPRIPLQESPMSLFTCGRGLLAAALVACGAVGPIRAQASGSAALRRAGTVPVSDVRLASGRPGARYWQQRADYRIDVALDPAHDSLTGSERITYRNNAPEALGE